MTNGSKGSRYSGSVYVAEWKTQNSTTYYYNRSGAREQEEFLLEYKFLQLLMFVRGSDYKFLQLFMFVRGIVENLTMWRGFLWTA